MQLPKLLTAAISVAVLLFTSTACTTEGEADTNGGAKVQRSGSKPKVLITVPYDPVADLEGVDWTGRLRYVPGCDCILLEEDDAKGALTFIAWQDGTRGYSEGSTLGVQLPDGRRLEQDDAVTGFGSRATFKGPPPVVLPAPYRLKSDCLFVATVD